MLRATINAMLDGWRKAQNTHNEMAKMIWSQTGRDDTRQQGYADMLTVCIRDVEAAIEITRDKGNAESMVSP